MALLIKSNGSEETLESTDLKSLQIAVGGYIECLPIKDGKFVIVNEEGRPRNLPVNDKASYICGFEIVGDAVVCSKWELN